MTKSILWKKKDFTSPSVFLKPQRAREQKLCMMVTPMLRGCSHVIQTSPFYFGESHDPSHTHTHTHIQINSRYAKCFYLKKELASGCHTDKPGGRDYYLLHLPWPNTLIPQKPELMQEIRTACALTPIYPFSYLIISEWLVTSTVFFFAHINYFIHYIYLFS